jgi:two-component system NarL family sensor kinase
LHGLAALPAGVEVAVYAIAAEGLANAARHARARSVRLEVGPADCGLAVRVADDGVGIDAQGRPGVGLVSMRRRAEELGGTFVVTPGPGGAGTLLEARLPLESP